MLEAQPGHNPEQGPKQSPLEKLKQKIQERLPKLEHASYTLRGVDTNRTTEKMSRTSSRLTEWVQTTEAGWMADALVRVANSKVGKLFSMQTDAKVQTLTERLPAVALKQLSRKLQHEPLAGSAEYASAQPQVEHFASGVDKVHMEVGRESADLCVAPVGAVPEFIMVKDLLPSPEGEVTIGASHSYLAESMQGENAPLLLNGCGWFVGDSIAFGDVTYMKANEGVDTAQALQEFTRRTMVSLGARRGDEVYGIDDFFTDIRSWQNEGDYAGRVYFRSQEPHWIVTTSDNDFAVRSLSELRSLQDISTIESIVPSLGMIDEENAQDDEINNGPVDLNGAVIFEDAAGKKRIATIQGGVRSTPADIFAAAKKMAEATGGATNLQVLLFDGGRSRGTVVDTGDDREIINGYEPSFNTHELIECMIVKKPVV